jgi:CTP synthase (UTP-ammonia lyase)
MDTPTNIRNEFVMSPIRIALVGDFNPEVLAHRAIEKCFALACQSEARFEPHWMATESIAPGNHHALEAFAGIWCVPASPYRNTDGALSAIQFARTHSVPFLGTCGGYQHALLEFARDVLGLNNSGHTELDPAAPVPLLDRMHCALIEQSQKIVVTDQQFRSIYGADSGLEAYHCSYGLNPHYEPVFAGSPMKIVARSVDGQARAFRLEGHPFFIGTQFQPERQALAGSIHPLVRAFFSAARITRISKTEAVTAGERPGGRNVQQAEASERLFL